MTCEHRRSRVVGSRNITEHGIVRRRECVDCGHRWGTMEVPIDLRPGKLAPRLIAKVRAAVDAVCEEFYGGGE